MVLEKWGKWQLSCPDAPWSNGAGIFTYIKTPKMTQFCKYSGTMEHLGW
jgi:hypothetical protein